MGMKPFIDKPDLLQLLEACHRRTEQAQHQLYQQFYPFARHIALQYADDSAGAEDIVQDAFIKLFVNLEMKAFAGDFEKFFRRIVVNTGIDHYRASSTRRRFAEVLRSNLSRHTANNAIRELAQQDVYHFLQRLTSGYRLVFNLYVIEGYSHPEIAQKLGISVGTSKSNLAKARKQLQAVAGPYFQL